MEPRWPFFFHESRIIRVNGLQTTESIHKHYASSSLQEADSRTLLVKVIVSQDESVRDEVIRATNNQTTVEPAALHATEKIQRDIEEILLRYEWYYERRTNYFKNEGRPEGRILSPLVMAAGSVALLLKNPARSSRLRQKHLRTEEAYQVVYSQQFPIEAWPIVASLIRASENAILRSQARGAGGRQRLAHWRGPLAYFAAVRSLGTFSYSVHDLTKVDVSRATDEFMDECWAAIARAAGSTGSSKVKEARIEQLGNVLASRWNISGNPHDGKRELLASSIKASNSGSDPETEKFLAEINAALPTQPWKPGIHVKVAGQLGVKPAQVTRAIQTLIARGKRLQQRDGVVYDASGSENQSHS